MTDDQVSAARVTFNDGLPGFESCRHFHLVTAPESAPFAIVQGEGERAPAFVAIDPALIVPDYARVLDRNDAARLESDGTVPLLWLAIVTLHEDGRATANLRAPLVINPASMRGIQVVSATSPYRIDHPLPTS
jgi:flagellar assembly factor FliW